MPFKLGRNRGNEEVEIGAKDVIGMTEEELKTQLGKIDEISTKLSAVDDIKATLAGLEGKITAAAKSKGSEGGNGGDGGEGGGNSNEDNPLLVAIADTRKMTLETNINVIKSDIKRSMKEDGRPKYPYWETFEKEIEELTKNDPLVAKNRPEYWDSAYNIVVGRHLDDIQAGTVKTKKMTFVEGGGSGSGGSGTNNTKNPLEPTDIDRQQAAKFNGGKGIPIEKYMETKAKMRFVGGN